MAKKLSLLIAAVAVLAFAVPTVAGAAEVTYPAGTRAPVGQSLTGTGKNVTLTSSTVGVITCETLNLNASIKVNNGTTIEASGENATPTQAGCYNREPSRVVKVSNVTVSKLFANESNGPAGTKKNGTVSFTAKVELPAGVTCNFTGTNVPGTFISTESPSVLTAEKGGGITSTGGCGTATLDGSFSLHGPGSTTTPVVLH